MESHETPEPSISELWSLVQAQQAEIAALKQKRQRRFRIPGPSRISGVWAVGLLAVAIGFGPSLASAAPATTQWLLSGNAGTTASSFLGTSDSKPLVIKTNNTTAMTVGTDQNITANGSVNAVGGLKENGQALSSEYTKVDGSNATGSWKISTTGSAAGFTGTLGGDVSGAQGSTVVGKINGSPLGNLSGAATGNVLAWNGTSWVPTAPSSGGLSSVSTGTGLTGNGTSSSPLAVDTSTIQARVTGTCTAGDTVTGINADGSVSCQPPARWCPGCTWANATLSGQDMSYAYIPNANLTGANLTGANLSSANLTNANLQQATLIGAQLLSANLTGADLSIADLTSANLFSATLTHASLAGANLVNADLAAANLSGATGGPTATVTGVRWSNTICPDGTNSNNDSNTCVGHGF